MGRTSEDEIKISPFLSLITRSMKRGRSEAVSRVFTEIGHTPCR